MVGGRSGPGKCVKFTRPQPLHLIFEIRHLKLEAVSNHFHSFPHIPGSSRIFSLIIQEVPALDDSPDSHSPAWSCRPPSEPTDHGAPARTPLKCPCSRGFPPLPTKNAARRKEQPARGGPVTPNRTHYESCSSGVFPGYGRVWYGMMEDAKTPPISPADSP
jgi:hypothetical protein